MTSPPRSKRARRRSASPPGRSSSSTVAARSRKTLMADKTFITCAVTGNLTKPEQTPHLPITAEHIANECLGAAAEGAAAVHIHARAPKTGKPSMEDALYPEAMQRIREKDAKGIINLTTGPGRRFGPSTDG